MTSYIPPGLQDYVLQACQNPIYRQTALRPPPCLFECCDEAERQVFSEYASSCFREAGMVHGSVLNLYLDGSLPALWLAEEQIVDAICTGSSNDCSNLVSVLLHPEVDEAWRETLILIRDLSYQTVVFLFLDGETEGKSIRSEVENELSRLKVFHPEKLVGNRITDYVCTYIRKQGFEIADMEAFSKCFAATFSAVATVRQAQQVADILMDCAVKTQRGWSVGVESIRKAVGG